MPRPKRTKIALSAFSATTSITTNRQLDLISTASSERVNSGSDDSEGLVRTKKLSVHQIPIVSQEATMTGALAPGDTSGARLRPPTGRKRALLSRIARDADHDKEIEALKTMRDPNFTAGGMSDVQAPSSLFDGASPVGGPPAEEEKKVSLTITKDSIDNGKSEVQVITGTNQPALGASNIRRRLRKPSLLQLVQAKAHQQDEDEDEDEDDDDDELGNFSPDDESTPFHNAKPFSNLQRTPSSPHILSTDKSSSSRKRKLTSPEIQVPMSQPARSPSLSTPLAPSSPVPELEIEDNLYTLPYTKNLLEPSLPLPNPVKTPPPKIWSDTLAPPQSSSPTREISSIKSRKRPTKPTKVPSSNAPKPLSTATLQNLLPRRRRSIPSIPQEGPSTFSLPPSSTSDLELDMSHLAEDEDELNTNTAQPKFHAKPQRIPRKSPIKKRGRGRPRVKVSNQEKPGFRERKTYARSKKVDPQEVENENENNVRSGEEEEEEDEEDVGKKGDSGAAGDGVGKGKEGASGTAQGRKGRCKPLAELKRLAQKFKEVDEWELEIEDVTTSSSGLMKDAR